MRLTVIKSVNERIGKPAVSAHSVRSKFPGDAVDIGDVVFGEEIEGNSLWYQSLDGLFFYWSGAFKETNFQVANKVLADFTGQQQFSILTQLKDIVTTTLNKTVSFFSTCGIGRKNYEDQQPLCLIVYVSKKLPVSSLEEMVVKNIFYRGIRILSDVVELKPVIHHSYIQYSAEFLDGLQGDNPPRIGEGIKGSEELGTISLRAFRDNAQGQTEAYALACYHVLCSSLLGASPAVLNCSAGSGQQSSFAISNGSQPKLRPVEEGAYSNQFDYAAVRLNTEFDIQNKIETVTVADFFHFDEMHLLTDSPMTVKAIGKTSYLQTGKVLSIMDSPPIPPLNQVFSNVVCCEKISMPGDSGAPVIEISSGKLVGFVIAGDNQTVSYVIPFYNLFTFKNFYLK